MVAGYRGMGWCGFVLPWRVGVIWWWMFFGKLVMITDNYIDMSFGFF